MGIRTIIAKVTMRTGIRMGCSIEITIFVPHLCT